MGSVAAQEPRWRPVGSKTWVWAKALAGRSAASCEVGLSWSITGVMRVGRIPKSIAATMIPKGLDPLLRCVVARFTQRLKLTVEEQGKIATVWDDVVGYSCRSCSAIIVTETTARLVGQLCET